MTARLDTADPGFEAGFRALLDQARETTQRVDFHSFRRAFNTALAEADVNVQRAMHLAGHSDPRVHASYVMSTKRMQQIPAAALPQLPEGLGTALPFGVPLVSAPATQTANDAEDSKRRGSDSNRRMTVLQTVA